MKVRSFSYMNYDPRLNCYHSHLTVEISGEVVTAQVQHSHLELLSNIPMEYVRRKLVDHVMSEVRNRILDQM